MAQALTGEDRRSPAAAPASLVEYVCPMHPQIVRNAPGSCPICGMALEPKEPSAVEQHESRARRYCNGGFWISPRVNHPGIHRRHGRDDPGQPLRHLATQRTWTWLSLPSPRP